MGGNVRRMILAAAMLALPVVAHAQTDRQQAAQIFLPNSGPRGDRDYKAGDYVLRVPLRWESAARLQGSVSVKIGEQSAALASGSLLPLVAVQERQGAGPLLSAYCTPRKSPHKVTGTIGLMGLVSNAVQRSWTDAQTCLIDKDTDGKFDHALLIGDGGALERVPHAIAPVDYVVENDAPISPEDEIRIRLAGVSAKHATFILEIVQRGVSQKFETIDTDRGTVAHRVTKSPIKDKLPFVARIYGADFQIVAADATRKTVKLNWAESAPRDVRRVVPETIRLR